MPAERRTIAEHERLVAARHLHLWFTTDGIAARRADYIRALRLVGARPHLIAAVEHW